MTTDKLSDYSDEEIEIVKNICMSLWRQKINCHGMGIYETLRDLLYYRWKIHVIEAKKFIEFAIQAFEEKEDEDAKRLIATAVYTLNKHIKLEEKFAI